MGLSPHKVAEERNPERSVSVVITEMPLFNVVHINKMYLPGMISLQ